MVPGLENHSRSATESPPNSLPLLAALYTVAASRVRLEDPSCAKNRTRAFVELAVKGLSSPRLIDLTIESLGDRTRYVILIRVREANLDTACPRSRT